MLKFIKNFMHQSFLVINAFFHRNHSFSSVNTLNIVYCKNYFLSMISTSRPYFTKNIELSGCNMCNSDKGIASSCCKTNLV